MSCLWGKVLHQRIYVSSKKTTEEEYNQDVERIAKNMRYFSEVTIIPWKDRAKAQQCRNMAEEIRTSFSGLDWEKFFSEKLEVALSYNEPCFSCIQKDLMVVSGKSISDEHFGVNAQAQSVPIEVFDAIKKEWNRYILGQHFDKSQDLEKIKKIVPDWVIPGLYADLPREGQISEKEVLGIRGVAPHLLHYLYKRISGCVGVAGTHTWFLLTVFPEKPQVILYHKDLEDWTAIARAARTKGLKIAAVEYDDTTTAEELKTRVLYACQSVGLYKEWCPEN